MQNCMRIRHLLKQVSAGGLAGPSFQALPEPAPLPTLPRPAPLLQMEQPAEAFAAMAPMAAPGSEAQPGSALQVLSHPSQHCQAFPWSSLSSSSCSQCQQPVLPHLALRTCCWQDPAWCCVSGVAHAAEAMLLQCACEVASRC